MKFFPAAILPLLLLAGGCAGGGGKWPSLAPRAGEISPLVPRNALGACAACAPDAAPVAPPAAPAIAPLPADADARLTAMEATLASVETRVATVRREAQAAVAAFKGSSEDRDIEAEVQASRVEAAYLPLGDLLPGLDALEDEIAGRDDAAALLARIAALRERLAGLEAGRTSS